jgi:hypothetical protein
MLLSKQQEAWEEEIMSSNSVSGGSIDAVD